MSEGWFNSKSGGPITVSPRRFLSLRSGQGDKEDKNDETRNDTLFDGLFGVDDQSTFAFWGQNG